MTTFEAYLLAAVILFSTGFVVGGFVLIALALFFCFVEVGK